MIKGSIAVVKIRVAGGYVDSISIHYEHESGSSSSTQLRKK